MAYKLYQFLFTKKGADMTAVNSSTGEKSEGFFVCMSELCGIFVLIDSCFLLNRIANVL